MSDFDGSTDILRQSLERQANLEGRAVSNLAI